MFLVIKKDYNESTQTVQVKLLGAFSHKGDAFNLADKHSRVGFSSNDDENAQYWSINYTARGHNYLIEIYNINDEHFDEVEVFNSKINTGSLGYSFTW